MNFQNYYILLFQNILQALFLKIILIILDDDDERNMQLKNFITGINLENGRIEKSIPANRIKELLERDFGFANTIVPLDDEEAKILYEECKSVFAK
ncbi:hypothetical protein D4R20_02690 [bacterium]|nr:MAG: hypothetical protein D4R20_02690 [bacterium]